MKEKIQKLHTLAKQSFSLYGLIIVFLSLLPTLILIFLPPVDAPIESEGKLFLTILEVLGRTAIIAILLFDKKGMSKKIDIWFVLMCVFGALYYAAWAQYFLCGRTYALLYSPLWFMPIPLAVFPILAFASAAMRSKNNWLLGAVFVMAVGHIPQSYLFYLSIY